MWYLRPAVTSVLSALEVHCRAHRLRGLPVAQWVPSTLLPPSLHAPKASPLMLKKCQTPHPQTNSFMNVSSVFFLRLSVARTVKPALMAHLLQDHKLLPPSRRSNGHKLLEYSCLQLILVCQCNLSEEIRTARSTSRNNLAADLTFNWSTPASKGSSRNGKSGSGNVEIFRALRNPTIHYRTHENPSHAETNNFYPHHLLTYSMVQSPS